MKFNKDKYKGSGRKPASSGSEPRPRKRPRVEDASTFQEWVPEPDPQDKEPISTLMVAGPGSAPPSTSTPPSSGPAPSPTGKAPAVQPRLSQPSNILDDQGLAVKRMEGIITPADLARTSDLAANKLAKGVAHNLARAMLFATELGTRYLESNHSCVKAHEEKEAVASKVAGLEVKLEQTIAKVEICEEDLRRSNQARDHADSLRREAIASLEAEKALKEQALELASERGRRLEELLSQVDAARAQAVHVFKEGDEAQDWLAETYNEGFEDAKKEISRLHPDLDLSSVSAFDEETPAKSPPRQDGQGGGTE